MIEIVCLLYYVGDVSDVLLVYMFYFEGIEFLYIVCYIGVDESGNIYNVLCMKEVCYMKKYMFRSRESLVFVYYVEVKDKYFEKLF